MTSTADATRLPQCWECLRRHQPCDGSLPVCNCCRSAGIVCPGYDDKRPLTWVTPGSVTYSRRRKPKTAATSSAARASTSASRKPQKPQKPQQQKKPQLPLSPPPEANPPAKAPDSVAIRTLSGVSVGTSLNSVEQLTADKEKAKQQEAKITLLDDEDTVSLLSDESLLIVNSPNSIVSAQHASRSPSINLLPQTTTSISSASIPTELRVQEWDLIEAIQYYNSQVFPTVAVNQLSPNVFAKPFDTQKLYEMIPSNRHAVISIALGYRIMSLTQINRSSIHPYHPGPATELWSSFFRYIGLALTALNEEIRSCPGDVYGKILRSIHLLGCAELFMLVSPHLRAHISGFLSMLNHHGGIKKILTRKVSTKSITLSFVIACVVVNTTSSTENQILAATELDIEDIAKLYKFDIYPPFLCPPHLFLDILHINRLRKGLPTKASMLKSSSEQLTLCDIMQHIDNFSPQEWIVSTNLKNEGEFMTISRIFQAAIVLYACATLSCTATSHDGYSCADLRLIYRAQLFKLLKQTVDSDLPLHSIYWPTVVAGVVAAAGTAAERAVIERHLELGLYQQFSGSGPLKAMVVLRKFWASGNTAWDECFKEKNVILVA